MQTPTSIATVMLSSYLWILISNISRPGVTVIVLISMFWKLPISSRPYSFTRYLYFDPIGQRSADSTFPLDVSITSSLCWFLYFSVSFSCLAQSWFFISCQAFFHSSSSRPAVQGSNPPSTCILQSCVRWDFADFFISTWSGSTQGHRVGQSTVTCPLSGDFSTVPFLPPLLWLLTFGARFVGSSTFNLRLATRCQISNHLYQVSVQNCCTSLFQSSFFLRTAELLDGLPLLVFSLIYSLSRPLKAKSTDSISFDHRVYSLINFFYDMLKAWV